jgi:hypothetical protein
VNIKPDNDLRGIGTEASPSIAVGHIKSSLQVPAIELRKDDGSPSFRCSRSSSQNRRVPCSIKTHRWDQFMTCVAWCKDVFLQDSPLRADYIISFQEIMDVRWELWERLAELEQRCREWQCLVRLSDDRSTSFQRVQIVKVYRSRHTIEQS